MSLIEALLNQRLVLLTLGGAGLLLLLALLLGVLSMFKAIRARRAVRRMQETAEQAAREMAEREVLEESEPVITLRDTSSKAASTTTSPSAAPASTSASAAPSAQPEAASTPVTSTETTTDAKPASESMLDLLSVFVEDNNAEKRAVLIRDLPQIDIHDLAALCSKTAAAFGGKAQA
ncbi:MAG: hypothetical protein SF029_09455 [bacterium]|nr:hypothetical protein [bacterium]